MRRPSNPAPAPPPPPDEYAAAMAAALSAANTLSRPSAQVPFCAHSSDDDVPYPVDFAGDDGAVSYPPKQPQVPVARRRGVYYRYRTFAERLGPRNARSIVFHYVGVLALSYTLFNLRALLVHYSER